MGGGLRLRRGRARTRGGRPGGGRHPRGALRGRLRVTDIRPGLLFVPFHYGYWDTEAGHAPDRDTPGRAANETTVTDWDPVSKQPLFKTAAAALRLVERGDGRSAPAPTTTASAPASGTGAAVAVTAGGRSALVTESPDPTWDGPRKETR